jgi:hypothetical protein
MERLDPIENRDAPQRLFSGPAYEPPYEGALQDEFAWHLVKYLPEDARLSHEVELEVPGAFYTADFVLEAGGRRVAFECSSAQNMRDHQRRLLRDASLASSGAVDVVYRLRGSDLLHHMDDVLYLIAQWDPALFSERGRINLETLATREARSLRLRPEQVSALLVYEIDPGTEEYFSERHLWHSANGTSPFILLRRLDRRFVEAELPEIRTEALRAAS